MADVDVGIDRIETATGSLRPVVMGVVSLSSEKLWNHLQVRRGQSGPRERPEGHYMRHVVAVSTGGSPVADFWSPGKRYIARRVLPGNVTIYPAGMPHASRWSASKTTIIDIAPEFVQAVAGRDVAMKHLEIHPTFALQDDVVATLAFMLGAEALADGPNGSLYGEGLGTALVAHLLRRHGVVPQHVLRGVHALSAGELQRVTQYIEENLDVHLSLQGLADVLGISIVRFVRSFKQSTGVPPHRYVLERRIAQSRSLLADPSLSLVDVALRAGFSSQSHFSTAFRQLTSITPGRYRKALGR
jgi:AraC family transcriptional regulator